MATGRCDNPLAGSFLSIVTGYTPLRVLWDVGVDPRESVRRSCRWPLDGGFSPRAIQVASSCSRPVAPIVAGVSWCRISGQSSSRASARAARRVRVSLSTDLSTEFVEITTHLNQCSQERRTTPKASNCRECPAVPGLAASTDAARHTGGYDKAATRAGNVQYFISCWAPTV